MLKDEFLRQLELSLAGMSDENKKDIISDYAEHYEIGALNGRSEEEISLGLGDPRSIGKEYSALILVKRAEETPSAGGIGRAILATLGLGLFNLIIVLLPFLFIIGILAILLILFFSIACSGPILIGCAVLELIGIFPEDLPISSLGAIFIGVGMTCMGLLGILGEFWLARILYHLAIRYLKWNIAVIHGSEKI
ncbi:MAG: DUF1700 domain-containing protein [Methanomicrobiales archaeon]|nr:DUF1700 domain-containing protein [Methanomicrobiales archaeon]